MRDGCKVIYQGRVGRYIKVMPSGKMQIKFDDGFKYADIKDVRLASRLSDLPWIGWIFR